MNWCFQFEFFSSRGRFGSCGFVTIILTFLCLSLSPSVCVCMCVCASRFLFLFFELTIDSPVESISYFNHHHG